MNMMTSATTFATMLGTPTLADLIAAILAKRGNGIETHKCDEICSALRTIAKIKGKSPAQVSAVPGPLAREIKNIEPAVVGIGRRRWSNIQSLITAAFRLAGTDYFPGHSKATLTPEWQALWELLGEKNPWRYTLSRFFRFCSTSGYTPDQMSDEMMARFEAALEQALIFKATPKSIVAETCRTWNKANRHVAGWPNVLLTVPRLRETYTLPWTAFPQSLQDDVTAYTSSIRRHRSILADPVSTDITTKHRNFDSANFRLRQLLSALVHQGYPIDSITTLACLSNIDNFKLALRFFLDRSVGKSNLHIHELARRAHSVCRTWVKFASDDVRNVSLSDIATICRQLDPGPSGMTEKNRNLLKQFDDPRNVQALLDLPAALMVDAQNLFREIPLAAAYLAQKALAVELLLMTRMRIGDMTDVRPDDHFTLSRVGRQPRILVTKKALKTGYELQFDLRQRTIDILETYRRIFLPTIFPQGTKWLFPTRNGQPQHSGNFGQSLRKLVSKRTGIRINPHLYRHMVAVEHLKKHPGEYHVVARTLGHSSANTAMRYYTGPEINETLRYVDDELLGQVNRPDRKPRKR